jgi:membrane associated rhomboid family serine protease
MAVCYRHPSRETGVSCSSCGRPICPDCMTPTSVGMRCPECARERTKVKTLRSRPRAPQVTQVIIAINAIVFLAETATGAPLGGGGGGSIWNHGVLFGPAITGTNPYPFFTGTHEYWRLVTAGFLHDGLLHILFNMVFLYFMGPMLEPAIGRLNFAVVYFVSLLAGSFGALLFQPLSPTVGASGACFGVLGALIVVAYYRGISIWQSGLGLTLVINIVFSLSIAGISIGGHLGGVVGGAICGWLIVQLDERRNMKAAALAGCALVAVLSIIGAAAVAGSHGLAPGGIGFGS